MQKRFLPVLILGLTLWSWGCTDNNGKSSDAIQEGEINNSSALALVKASAAIEEDPDNPDLYFQRAQLYYDFGSFEEGIIDMEKAIQLDKDIPEYYHLLADLQLDAYQSGKALNTLEGAILLFPKHTHTILKYSEFLYLLRQYEQSIEILRDLLIEKPDNGEAFFMLGLNYKDLKDTTSAKQNFQIAIQNDPDLIDGWINLGQLYGSQRDPMARQYFESAYQIQPNNVEVLHSYAFYLQSVDEIEEAMVYFQKIINIDPQYTTAYFNMGLLYLDQSKYTEAIDQFTLAIATDPVQSEAYFFRGISKELKGNNEGAISDYQQALMIDPDLEVAQEALRGLQ